MKAKTDVSGIAKKLARIKARYGVQAATEAMRGMSPYVPFHNGYLDASARAGEWRVTYRTSYARRVYYGKKLKFSQERHQNATYRWADAYRAQHGRELARAIERLIRR